MSCVVYKLTDFDQIKKNGISYILPQTTIDVIKQISTNVGAPEYVKTPHFDKKGGYRNNNSHNSHPIKGINIDNWNATRNFKPTVMEKKKGIDLSLDKMTPVSSSMRSVTSQQAI